MENSDSDGSSIITFKQRTCYTNIYYRENFTKCKGCIKVHGDIIQYWRTRGIQQDINSINYYHFDNTRWWHINSHSDDDTSFDSIRYIGSSLDNSLDRSVFSGFTTFTSNRSSDSSSDSDTYNSTVSSILSHEDNTVSSSSLISS